MRAPCCRAPLVEEGGELCCTGCGERYPVVDGVAVFAKAALSEAQERQREIFSELCRAHCDAYRTVESYDARAIQNWKKMRAISALVLSPGDLVLDVGCSDGFWLRFMAARYGVSGIGVDLADAIFAASRQDRLLGFRNRFSLSEAERLPLDDGVVDCVISFDLLEHLPRPDIAVAEMVRVLKPGGQLLIHMPVRDYGGSLLGLLAAVAPRYFRARTEAIGHFYAEIITSGQLRAIFAGQPLELRRFEKFGGWVQPLYDWYLLRFFGSAARAVVRPRRESRAPTTPLGARPAEKTGGRLWRTLRLAYRCWLALWRSLFLAAHLLIDRPLARLGIGYTVYALAKKGR